MFQLLSRPLISMVIFLILAFLVFSSAINGEFLYDDIIEIKENPNVHHVFPLSESMFGYHQLPVRPLPYLTFAMNYEWLNGSYFGFHVVNILIHVMNAWLIWSILIETLTLKSNPERYQKYALPVAYLITLIWMVHPLVAMPVNYIYQRMEEMMSLFLLMSLYCSIKVFHAKSQPVTPEINTNQSRKQKSKGTLPEKNNHLLTSNIWMMLAIASCVAGVFCKEVMIVAPLLILWYDRAFVSPSFFYIFEKRLYFYVSLFLTWVLLFALIVWQNDHYAEHYSDATARPWNYLLTQTQVLLLYLKLTFWPSPLCFEYKWPIVENINQVLLPGTTILLMLLSTLYLMVRYPKAGFAAGLFFLILAPTSSFKPVLAPVFEHRMYLPIMGPILLCMILLVEILHRLNWLQLISIQKSLVTIILFITTVLGIVNWQRGKLYSDYILMWEDTKIKAPTNFRAPFQLCEKYFLIGEYEKCKMNALESIRLEPVNPRALHNLGLAYFKLNEDEKGWEAFRKVLEFDPKTGVTLRAMGNKYLQEKQYQKAYEYFMKTIDADPGYADAYHGVALSLMYLGGKVDLINKYFNSALSMNPEDGRAHYHYALFLDSLGKVQQSLIHAEAAAKLLPDNEDVQKNYMMLLKKAQDMR